MFELKLNIRILKRAKQPMDTHIPLPKPRKSKEGETQQ